MKNYKVTKLQNAELENVVAGAGEITVKSVGKGTAIGCGAVALASAISSFGCQIASTVYSAKANKASDRGNSAEATRLRKLSHNTGIAATSLGGAALVAAGAGVAVGLPTGGLEAVASDASDLLVKHNFYKMDD